MKRKTANISPRCYRFAIRAAALISTTNLLNYHQHHHHQRQQTNYMSDEWRIKAQIGQ